MRIEITEKVKKIAKISIVAVSILILETIVFSYKTNAVNPEEVATAQQTVSEKATPSQQVKEGNVNEKEGTTSNSKKETTTNKTTDNSNSSDKQPDKKADDYSDIEEAKNVDDKEAVVQENMARVYPKWQKERKKPTKEYEYSIKVNKTTNTVTIYIKEEDGKLTPYKAMVCSVGREGHPTPEGKGYHTSEYYDWRLMVDNTYGRYAVRFNGSIMFHSVPYYETKKNSLEWEDYNKLGSPASLGCIRLAVADAKWIFDNCRRGTEVEVYSGPASTDPLGTPEAIKLDTTSEYRDWDPTDLTPENPWLVTIE